MKSYVGLGMVFGLAAAFAAGCAKEKETAAPAPPVDGSKYLLSQEPEGAVDVRQIRETSQDEDDVVVVGRIGGEEDPWVEGVAAFSIVDLSIKSCNEIGDDACPKPWDFC